MNNEQQPFTVEVRDVMDLMHESVEQGMSVASLLRELGLPGDHLADPAALIDMDDCWRIIAANQNQIHEESHLKAARSLRRGTTRMIFSNLGHCRQLQEGLQALAETYNIVHGGDYNFVRRRGGVLSYIVDDRDFHYRAAASPFAIEFALLKIHCALSYLSGRPLKLLRVATRRPQLPGHHHHLHLFEAPLQAGHEVYELAYRADQAELPLSPAGDIDIAGNIYAHYLALLQRRGPRCYDDDFIHQVLQVIRRGSAPRGTRQQEAVAAALGMSVATLRRRLARQDTSFRRLLDKVNSELAVDALHQRVAPADVAQMLGYSEVRAFKRAFRRWYGVSPTMYLKHHELLR